jgi:hypothetical protein
VCVRIGGLDPIDPSTEVPTAVKHAENVNVGIAQRIDQPVWFDLNLSDRRVVELGKDAATLR